MSNWSQFFNSSVGPFYRNPLFMPKFYGDPAYLTRTYSASSTNASATAFFTGGVASVDRIPGTQIVNPSWTTAWQTVATVASGSGIISDIIPPGNVGGGGPNDVECRVTLDGVLFPTIAFGLTAVGQRGWMGWGMPTDAYHSGGQYVFQHAGAPTAQYSAQINSAGAYVLTGPQDPRTAFFLYFASSLLVEARMATGTGGGGVQDYAAVVMRRFT